MGLAISDASNAADKKRAVASEKASDTDPKIPVENFLAKMACSSYGQEMHDNASNVIATYERVERNGESLSTKAHRGYQIAKEMKALIRKAMTFNYKDDADLPRAADRANYLREVDTIRKTCEELDILRKSL
jgi:hypothetical protein